MPRTWCWIVEGDRDDFSIDTTEGQRPGGSFGDRLLIAVAGLALLGGALVAIGNVLPRAPEAVRASANPDAIASATPSERATPRPTRKPATATLIHLPELTASPTSLQPFYGWIRTRGEVALYSHPESSEPFELLPAGFIGHAAAGPFYDEQAPDGWLMIEDPSPQGWIDASDETLVERFPESSWPGSADLQGIAAGADGFVAWGNDASGAVALYASSDGAAWAPANLPHLTGGYIVGVAHGPVGWIAVIWVSLEGQGPWQSTQVVFQSDDGLAWTPWGALQDTSLNIGQLVGSEAAYVAIGGNISGQTGVWSSTDGVAWHEQPAAVLGSNMGGWGRAWPLADGVLVSSGVGGDAFFSRDGTTWLPATDGPGGDRMLVIEQWDGLLAVDEDPRGAPRTWRGVIGREALTWQRQERWDEALAGTRLTALVHEGDQVLGVGWEVNSAEPIAWRMTVSGWRPAAPPPSEMGGVPFFVASDASSAVVVGYRPTLEGVNPVIWRLKDQRWTPEAEPVVQIAPDAAERGCPPLPTDALNLLTVDAPAAVRCHGAAETTVRAFVADCPDCFGGVPEDVYEPRWLADYSAPSLLISPLENGQWGGSSLAIHPSLTYDADWIGQEVELTGHFDDPASADCRWLPAAHSAPWRIVPAETVNACRLRFVVTAVTPLD